LKPLDAWIKYITLGMKIKNESSFGGKYIRIFKQYKREFPRISFCENYTLTKNTQIYDRVIISLYPNSQI